MGEVTINLADLTHCPEAAKWAAAFKQTFPNADEALMLGWFANAMMAMHDWKEQQIAPQFAALTTAQAEIEALRARVAELEGALNNAADRLNALAATAIADQRHSTARKIAEWEAEARAALSGSKP